MKILESFFEKRDYKKRKKNIISLCGCITYCPFCKDMLNDQADWVDDDNDGIGEYRCHTCGKSSRWNFVAFPFPVIQRLSVIDNKINLV